MTKPDTSIVAVRRISSQWAWWFYGWVFIRPLRYLSHKAMMGSFGLRLKPEKSWDGWRMPNPHLWLWYKTYGSFFIWLKWEGWRPFCDWSGGWRRTFPIHARILMKIGETMVWHFGGNQCYHCAHSAGCQMNLSDDDTGKTFKLLDTWTCSTQDGTDQRFRGITICPVCGYQQEYEDGSL